MSSIIESNGIQIQFNNLSEGFDPNQSTYVLTHGWLNSPSTWANDMASTLLYQSPNANVITVDWSEIAGSLNYFSVVDAVPIVGSAIANYLQDLGINPQETQLIGHSLGAHISGIAGDLYNELAGYQIDTIVGLDPAGIDFEPELFIFPGAPESKRLDPSDANQVIAFHTSSILGYDRRLADLDLYINPDRGLSSQPGKKDFIGDHFYATELYNQLLRGKSFTQTDTVSAIGPWFNLSDLNLTGSFDINTVIEADINDTLEGGDGNDILNPGGYNYNPFNDVNDVVDGGAGDELLRADYSSKNNDYGIYLYENENLKDRVTGSALVQIQNVERLEITGTQYVDVFEGGIGDDIFKGGADTDYLTGGAGNDTFVFNSLSTEIDTITDFEVSIDTIQMASEFGASYNNQFSFDDTNGALSLALFKKGECSSLQSSLYASSCGSTA